MEYPSTNGRMEEIAFKTNLDVNNSSVQFQNSTERVSKNCFFLDIPVIASPEVQYADSRAVRLGKKLQFFCKLITDVK